MVAIVAGAIANKPGNGGAAWVRLSWILGLRRLGFDVWFVEQVARENVRAQAWFDDVASRFALRDRASLIVGRGETIGLSWQSLLEVADESRLLINLSAHLTLQPLLQRARRTVCVDLDPGVTQFWQAEGLDATRLDGHDFYFTVGANVGTPRSFIPTNGIHWRPMLPPCVLDEWPVVQTPEESRDRFTTIASWRGPYGRVKYKGRTYGIKLDELRKFITLPQEATGQFEIALDIDPKEERDATLLESHGWHLVDPAAVAGDPDAFRSYVQGSAAEFSVAQGVYVETASGWFSDRSTRYMASGKPVLVQDTGFTRSGRTGEGLLTFVAVEDAAAGVNAIIRDYPAHAQAARALAVEHFDSDKVLARLLNETGV